MRSYLPKNQAGFSLVEAVLVTVLMLFVFAVFGAFLMRVTKTSAEYGERAKQNEDSSLTTQVIVKDLERAGANITLSSNYRFSGQIYVPFYNNSAYTIFNRRITRNRGYAGAPLISTVLWGGKGELRWQGEMFSLTVRNSSVSRQVSSYGNTALILENGELKASPSISPNSVFSIIFSSVIVNDSEMCHVRYLAGNQQLYESAAECTAEGMEVSIELQPGGFMRDVELNAAELTLREPANAPVRLPLLPMYEGQRPTVPLIETASGFLLLGGDDTRDSMFLSADMQFNDETYLMVNSTEGLRRGDVLLVSDYLNNRSVLLYVAEDEGGDVLVLPLTEPYMASDTGFEKFYSPREDFENVTFTKGTRVVRLTPPVEYSVQTENDLTSLYRRVGASAWELVAPNIQNYAVNQSVSHSSIEFGVSFDVLSEGIENDQFAQPVRVSVNPRALNRTYDAR